MRLRRLCEVKPTGKCWVDMKSREDYVSGGERREWLELALLESLKKIGVDRASHKKVVAGLLIKVYFCHSHVALKNRVLYTMQSHLVTKPSNRFTLHRPIDSQGPPSIPGRLSSIPAWCGSESACPQRSRRLLANGSQKRR